jgi:signal transduction histidine kinase
MTLRTRLLALSLLTLLLPWSGWKLLQELEHFLREAQEGALLASARTLAGALPVGYQTQLLFLPERHAPLRSLMRAPVLDGYPEDWPGPEDVLAFSAPDGGLDVGLLAGRHGGRLYLLFDVRRPGPRAGSGRDVIELLVRSPRGLSSYRIAPEAPGPLQLRGEPSGAGQAEGYWLDRASGYRVELALPVAAADTDIGFRVEGEGQSRAGTLAGSERDGRWIRLLAPWDELSGWLRRSQSAASRTWLVDAQGWVLADSGDSTGSADDAAPRTTWLQRLLYRLVAGSRTQLRDEPPGDPVRLKDAAVTRAIAGQEGASWTQDLETAVVWNTVAAPVVLQGGVHGAIVTQASSDGLLLVTNRALGRLLFTTLALTIGLALGLWYFATRLSRRVQRLSGAVSRAMEDGVDPEALPLSADRDELGELARNNEKLLRAVADYSQYLQTLAGKLSHELKTPLAITRSSLDNLASQALDAESRRFLERAREGVDRQAAIVRAMSEASRLEAAIGAAEWQQVDLVELVGRCVGGYRSVHPTRDIAAELPGEPLLLECAPDLLAQALDKLVDNALGLSGEQDRIAVILRPEPGRIGLLVRNTGSRLPDEWQDRLFDSLVSLREKRGSAPHLGLGLYIVRLVAAAHGGEVAARNLPDGQGVEFRIELPRV